jgi:oligopeptide/dipeptide ABC transporter ATP-binding protein
MGSPHNGPLIEVQDLSVQFGPLARPVRAVERVSFEMASGETLALVGESGCGKSVTALALARLVPQPPGRYASGRVLYRGEDVLAMDDTALRALRGNEISYVFQDPGSSLNPVFRVGYQIREALYLHRPAEAGPAEVHRLLEMVGIPDPRRRARAYPHELSGGMQQRVMIAMALACRPRVLVADEPTTALDVTIQAQILDLLRDLQRQMEMAVLLITHNLGLVADVAHRLHVMYAGRIVEAGPAAEVLSAPRHPYTRALLGAVPRLKGTEGRLQGIPGSVPNPGRLPPGCTFHPRCPACKAPCRATEPPAEDVTAGHWVKCHYWNE